MSAIGIFGGTFDPIHHGHLRSALELGELLGLSRVHMIPCHIPPHREQPGASAADRLAMLRLAVEGSELLIADDRELQRPEASYTVDTLRDFARTHPQQRRVLFIGVDAFAAFTRWHEWQTILEMADLAIMDRPGAVLSAPSQALLDEREVDVLPDDGSTGRIIRRRLTQLDISSTVIRATLAAGGNVRYLLPPAVRDYLQTRQLYRSASEIH
ncbi:nicotinate-nucleotide adenylyltransferase [Granulosicoccaceae sp. 1_MG-2023]|nr:nicotinate-nucleotide adenylyltransferase [Granulosicoccaceae sp. 1_MG-2023]